MNKIPFKQHHLLRFLHEYENQSLPMDVMMGQYFRAHPAVGSKDRAYIAETSYGLIRWLGLIDYLNGKDHSWESRVARFEECNPVSYKDDREVPTHICCSFPEELFALLVDNLGQEAAETFCQTSNTPAPTTIRANALKISRQDLMDLLSPKYPLEPCSRSPWGIRLLKKDNFFQLPEFQQGYFEIQDEGSQLLAALVDAKPGELVLDYCAGSGGKTLAFAPGMANRGQIFLHDVRKGALLEARKRLKRAGIQNAQLIEAESLKFNKMKRAMDWVLVDAPCTGTGTLRRNPDMKWKIDKETVVRLTGLQRQIFEKALSFVKTGGRIVYATCSVLSAENEAQIDHFCKTYSLKCVGEPLVILPTVGGMDGFFGAILKRND